MADVSEHGTVVLNATHQLVIRKKELELSTHRVQIQRFEIAVLESKLRDKDMADSICATNLRIETLIDELKKLSDADALQTEEG